MKRRSQSERYAASLGDEARERQERLARERYVCCGMPKNGGHHEACPERPDEPDVKVEGQTSLL